MLGRDGTRNAVSPESDPPTNWSLAEHDGGGKRLIRASRGIRWSAPLGSATFSSPVIASGLVWIGTNSGSGETSLLDAPHGFFRAFGFQTGSCFISISRRPSLTERIATPCGAVSAARRSSKAIAYGW